MDFNTYKHIRNISWNLLIDSNTKTLPTKITPIAKLFGCENKLNYNNTRYENTLVISNVIIDYYGLSSDAMYSEMLCVRILAPAIVLEKLKVLTPEQIVSLTDLPFEQAQKRLTRLNFLRERNVFELSTLEQRVLLQFKDFIENFKQ